MKKGYKSFDELILSIHDEIRIKEKKKNLIKRNKMSFELTPVMGNTEELDTDLVSSPLHEREEIVIPKIKEGIKVIVDALGGYLSVSCNGNLNPISGETGEEVNIRIVSLSPTQNTSVQIPAGEPETVAEVEATQEKAIPLTEHLRERENSAERNTMPEKTLTNPEGKTNEQIDNEAQENIEKSKFIIPHAVSPLIY